MANASAGALRSVVVAFYAAALFALNYAIGAALTVATGTPGASGLITGLTTAFVMFIACFTLGRRWDGAFVFGLYCLFAWPTVLMGPPGYHKVITGLVAGAAFGAVLFMGRSSSDSEKLPSWVRSIGAWFLFTTAIVVGTYAFFEIFNFPGKDRFLQAIWIFAGVFFVLGILGLWGGRAVALRLVDTETFKQLRLPKS